ncbi:unnamed protein product [Amoebophrya sp. A120]|nr:unnamed protein product [Amoebophrya sp. A120]|eukprot:GSA120T00017368001.1
MSGERFSQLSAELYLELEQAKKNIKAQEDALYREISEQRAVLERDFEERYRDLQARENALAEEKRIMTASNIRENDVISINAGGEIFTMKRSTLTQVFPQSYLANLFSGRWESSIERDQHNNYFLDFDPASFHLILTYLRDKKIETPERPAAVPLVAVDKKEHFENLLSYLGLKDQVPVKMNPGAAASPSAPQQQQQDQFMRDIPVADDRRPRGVSQSKNSENSAGHGTDGTTTGGEDRTLVGSQASLPQEQLQPAPYGRASVGSATVPARMDTEDQPSSSQEQQVVPKKSVPGWSRRYAHPSIVLGDDGQICQIPDTRQIGNAAAIRATRGFNKGTHAWQVTVLKASDYSYLGFVDDAWNHFQCPLGKAQGSWGIAANGTLHVQKHAIASEKVIAFGDGSKVGFVLDMEERVCHVKIDEIRYDRLFTDLPSVIYPAVSNCRSPAVYKIEF